MDVNIQEKIKYDKKINSIYFNKSKAKVTNYV